MFMAYFFCGVISGYYPNCVQFRLNFEESFYFGPLCFLAPGFFFPAPGFFFPAPESTMGQNRKIP